MTKKATSSKAVPGKKCEPGCECARHARKTSVCPVCQLEKSETEWYYRVRNGKRQRGSLCRLCHAEDGRARRLRTLFNLEVEDYERILEAQAGACYICQQKPKTGGQRLAVDHDHKTGLVRGLLCWGCNVALGKFKDDRERVLRAALYIQSPPAVEALGREVYGVTGRVTNKRRKTRRKR